jgi:hypothetical protein
VWVEWIPLTVKFSTTAWVTATSYAVGDLMLYNTATPVANYGRCYRCIAAHTSGTFATDLAASKWVLVPVLDVLEDFVIDHVQGKHLLRNGQPEAGLALQETALGALEKIAVQEAQRNNRGGLLNYVSSAVAAVSATSRYLRYDTDQSLSTLQQLQALENAGITIASDGLMTLPGGYTIYLNTPP